MFDEWGKEDDQWRPDEAKWWKITKKSLKWFFSAFVFVFIGFLVLRMCLSEPPSEMEEPIWNEKLFSAYTEAKNNGTELEMLQIPTSNAFSDEGMFSLYTVTYTPSVNQLQLTLRYNNRAYGYLVQEYPEAQAIIDAGGQVYDFSLTVQREEGEQLLSSYGYITKEQFGYTFYRFVFDDIDLTGVSRITLNVAYVGAKIDPRHTISVYNYTTHKTVADLPYFSYSEPDRVTDGIKTKEKN
jgi:hypothetical protein